MSHGLLLMLENIDRRKNEIVPIDSNLDAETLQDHHKQLMVRCVSFGSLAVHSTRLFHLKKKNVGDNFFFFFTFCILVSNFLFFICHSF